MEYIYIMVSQLREGARAQAFIPASHTHGALKGKWKTFFYHYILGISAEISGHSQIPLTMAKTV